MIRGTTAKYTFKLPCRKDELLWATMEFWQPRNYNELLPIIKKLEHCSAADDSNELCVSLTAEETARFSDKYKAKTQLRAEKNDGTVFGSRVKLFTVYPMNNSIIEESFMSLIPRKDRYTIIDRVYGNNNYKSEKLKIFHEKYN